MAKYGPQSAWLLVGGKNLTGDVYSLIDRVEQILEEVHALGDSMEAHLPVGIARAILEAPGGLYDDRTAGMLAALQEQGQTRQLVAYGVNGNLAGQDAAILDGTYALAWERIAARDGLTKGQARHALTGDYKDAKVLHAISAETAASGDTESTASVDNGAATSDGATADLHVPDLTLGGYTSVTVKVRHSTDDISYADLATFANVTAAGDSERVTAAGTVNRYLAMSWLFNGAGSGQIVTPFVAVNRG